MVLRYELYEGSSFIPMAQRRPPEFSSRERFVAVRMPARTFNWGLEQLTCGRRLHWLVQ